MRRLPVCILMIVLALAHVRADSQQPAARIPAQNTNEWVVEGTATRAADVKIDTFQGRRALWLRNGTQAIKTGVQIADGTIEFDVAPMDRGDFVAIVFRRESFSDHENIYLRPRQSGAFMAIQYAPRTRGSSTWQLYPEFTAKTMWPRNEWTHVRVRVEGSKLDVFVGDEQTPTLSVPRLRHGVAAGDVAFWARVNDQPAEWAATLSNIQIRPAAQAAARVPAGAPPASFVAQWDVAGPVPTTLPQVETVPANLQWTAARAEESGLVNLNRVFRAQPQLGRQTAFLRATIDASRAERKLVGIGYSDDVTVFVNGEPVYSGINGWNTRIPEYVSFVDARFERAWLPLRAGRNEIILAVTDDQRFGWGAAMNMEPK